VTKTRPEVQSKKTIAAIKNVAVDKPGHHANDRVIIVLVSDSDFRV
jgi:hypothetical protein